MKYIVTKDISRKESLIIFSKHIKHSDFANQFSSQIIVSAGFCSIEQDSISFFGESISLNIESRPILDKKLFERDIY